MMHNILIFSIIALVHSTTASTVDLRCRNFDYYQINDIYCSSFLQKCFLGITHDPEGFENNKGFIYDEKASSHECVSFVQSSQSRSLQQLPIDFFTKHPGMKILNAKNLGLQSISRELIGNATRLEEINLDNNYLTGLIQIKSFLDQDNSNDDCVLNRTRGFSIQWSHQSYSRQAGKQSDLIHWKRLV